jgi:hypothetical protein
MAPLRPWAPESNFGTEAVPSLVPGLGWVLEACARLATPSERRLDCREELWNVRRSLVEKEPSRKDSSAGATGSLCSLGQNALSTAREPQSATVVARPGPIGRYCFSSPTDSTSLHSICVQPCCVSPVCIGSHECKTSSRERDVILMSSFLRKAVATGPGGTACSAFSPQLWVSDNITECEYGCPPWSRIKTAMQVWRRTPS